MSKQSEHANFEIVHPVIVDENGDVQPYPSVASAIRAVETIDISNNEYAFYDSTGRILEARVQNREVSLVPTLRSESESTLLRSRILRVLSLLGDAEEDLSDTPFSDLANRLLRAFAKQT